MKSGAAGINEIGALFMIARPKNLLRKP